MCERRRRQTFTIVARPHQQQVELPPAVQGQAGDLTDVLLLSPPARGLQSPPPPTSPSVTALPASVAFFAVLQAPTSVILAPGEEFAREAEAWAARGCKGRFQGPRERAA